MDVDRSGIDGSGGDEGALSRWCWMDGSHRIPFDGPRGALGAGSGRRGSLITGSTDRAARVAAAGGSVRAPLTRRNLESPQARGARDQRVSRNTRRWRRGPGRRAAGSGLAGNGDRQNGRGTQACEHRDPRSRRRSRTLLPSRNSGTASANGVHESRLPTGSADGSGRSGSTAREMRHCAPAPGGSVPPGAAEPTSRHQLRPSTGMPPSRG